MNGTLNKVILIGNVGGDVKIHRFDENNLIGKLSLATSESYVSKETGKKVEQTEWHNLVVRNKLAEVFEKHVRKGDKIYVEGKLKTRKWQDQNGQDKYITEIVISEFTFLSNKSTGGFTQQGEQENQTTNSFKEDDGDVPF